MRIDKPKKPKAKSQQSIEEKVEEVDKTRKKISKEPFIPIGLIGGAGLIIYATNVKYMIIDQIMTFINQNPQLSDYINTLPYREAIMQNAIHMLFGVYAVLVVLIFLLGRFTTRRLGTRKKSEKKTG